jgi:hypothetical protein
VLALAACGGDGESGGDRTQATADVTTAPAQTQTGERESRAGTTGSSNNATKRRKARSRSGKPATGEEESLQLDNAEPAPPPTAQQRGRDADLPRGAPRPKSELKPEDRQVYDVARFFCRQAGIAGLRREYGIESTDPEDIAREAARRTSDRGDIEAVYSGCLTGLRQARQR